MGAGISQAAGLFHAGVKDKIFAVIGDSTFFHAGMPGLLNIAYNKSNVCVLILDNHVVAMTGHQPTPLTGITAKGEEGGKTSLEGICKSCGVKSVEVIDPFDVEKTEALLKEKLDAEGVNVVISRRPCVFLLKRKAK